jgi:hypothetical protein
MEHAKIKLKKAPRTTRVSVIDLTNSENLKLTITNETFFKVFSFNNTVPTTDVHYCQIIYAACSCCVFRGLGRKSSVIFQFLLRYLPALAKNSHEITLAKNKSGNSRMKYKIVSS